MGYCACMCLCWRGADGDDQLCSGCRDGRHSGGRGRSLMIVGLGGLVVVAPILVGLAILLGRAH